MNQPDDASLERFADAITLPRAEFERIYDEFATRLNARPFKVAAILSPPGRPFLNALQTARDGAWFDELAVRLTAVDAFAPANGEAAVPQNLRAELQSIITPQLGLLQMDHLNRGGINAMKRVCRVEVQAEEHASGTGFLIGPQAVLTARHVIAPLLDEADRPKQGSQVQLKVVFGDVGRLARQRECGVTLDWLIGSSACHELEDPHNVLGDIDKALPESFRDRLDYAILRLDTPIGRARGFYVLDAGREPIIGNVGGHISLYQHPLGGTMHMTTGNGLALWPESVRTRLRHNANSLPGTSGGLIVDRNFEPVAMHQCVYIAAGGVALVNGAIPTARIAARADPVTVVIGLDPMRRIEASGHPVIGRRMLQDHVMTLLTGERRILVVRGPDDSGKSFSTDIVRGMLDEASNVVVNYSAANISIDASIFASKLLHHVLGAEADTDLAGIDKLDTTTEAWIRDVLLPELLSRLQTYAGVRVLWLVIDDLDRYPLVSGSATASLLERLISDIAAFPFLRILLIGQSGHPAGAAFNQFVEDNIAPITQDEVEDYINARFVATAADRPLQSAEDLATAFIGLARAQPEPFLSSLVQTLTQGLQGLDGGDR